MNIYIENIGVIKKADIALKGITVIAGENDSGKSTVSKLLYYTLNDKWDKGYEPEGSEGLIRLYDNGEDILTYLFKDETLYKTQHNKPFFENTFYIESPFTIDDFSLYLKEGEGQVHNFRKADLINKLRTKNNAAMENYDEMVKPIRNKLGEVVSGRFETDKSGLKYVLAEKIIGAGNLAAGLKTYSLIKILIENYWMSSTSLFIFDEPEIHLHPDWQVMLAELLIMLRKELGVNILISTHSPYFLRAIQIYCKKYYIEENAKYYFAKKNGAFTSCISDITDDLSIAYATLSRPFENLLEEGALYDEQYI